jgi:glycosyltransferase involved in cell wall biosynthesis
LSDVKRQDLLIQAFAAITKTRPKLHLVIVGDGARRESLQTLANDLGVQKAVHFVGYRNDRERFLRAIDLFALTSESEGMPLAILEAWAAGLPVVASDCGGIPDVVTADRNGLLFRSGDVSALIDCISRAVDDAQLCKLISETGNMDVKTKYTLATMVANYERVYREVVDENAIAQDFRTAAGIR